MTWTGLGGDSRWHNPTNWSGMAVPGQDGEVVIEDASVPAITFDGGQEFESIRSVRCEQPFVFARGHLNLTDGNSAFNGPFTLLGFGLVAAGTNVSVAVNGDATVLGGSVAARKGAKVAFARLKSITNAVGINLSAADAGSCVDWSQATNIHVPTNGSLVISATNGGRVDLRRVALIDAGALINVAGPGSRVDLSALSGRWSSRPLSHLSVSEGGEILIPRVTALDRISVGLSDTGRLDTAQWKAFQRATLFVSGAAPDFGALTNVQGSGFSVRGGATVTLSKVSELRIDNPDFAFAAGGTNSVLDLSGVTNVVVAPGVRWPVSASDGGQVLLRQARIDSGGLIATATGSNSLVDLSGLGERWASAAASRLEATRDGTILLTNTSELIHIAVAVTGGGQLVTAPLRVFQSGEFSTDGAPNFDSVTNVDGSRFILQAGGTLTLPQLHTLEGPDAGLTFTVAGAHSRVDLSAITNITVTGREPLRLRAIGGRIDLSRAQVLAGPVEAFAFETNGVIDLSGLTGTLTAATNSRFGAFNEGALWLPNVTELDRFHLSLTNGGRVLAPRLGAFRRGALYVHSAPMASDDFASVTNLDGTRVTVLEGTFTLTNLTSLNVLDSNAVFVAEGPGSEINFSQITNITVTTPFELVVEALTGGRIDLSHAAIKGHALRALAAGTDSRVNLSGLSGAWNTEAFSHFVARDDGLLQLSNVTHLAGVTLTLTGGGRATAPQCRGLNDSGLVLDAAALDFAALTEFNNTRFELRRASVLTLTNLGHIVVTNASVEYRVMDAESVANLSGITNISIASNSVLRLAVAAGGMMDLSRAAIEGYTLEAHATGDASLIDLSGVTGSWRMASPPILHAEAGGQILLPNVTELDETTLDVTSRGALIAPAVRVMRGVTLSLNGGAADLSGLNHFDRTRLNVFAGSVLQLPGFTSLVVSNEGSEVFVSGIKSRLDWSNLTNLTIAPEASLLVRAFGGGHIDLRRVQTEGGPIYLIASGRSSMIDLSGLPAQWNHAGAALAVSGGATVRMPTVVELDGVDVNLGADANLTTAPWRAFRRGVLTLDGLAPDLGGLTNVDHASLYVYNGAVMGLTNVTSLRGAKSNYIFGASGRGSLIDLSSVTELIVAAPFRCDIGAFGGSRIDLRHLELLQSGPVEIYVSDPGSVVDFSALSVLISPGPAMHWQAVKGGTVLLTTNGLLLGNAVMSLGTNQPAILPPRVDATSNLVFYGRSGRSYRIETRDPGTPDSEWVLHRVVSFLQPVTIASNLPAAGVEFRVREVAVEPARLWIARGTNHAMSVLVSGVPGQDYMIESSTNVADIASWTNAIVFTLTNVFEFVPDTRSAAPQRYYRLRAVSP